jgi:hypothetical protein
MEHGAQRAWLQRNATQPQAQRGRVPGPGQQLPAQVQAAALGCQDVSLCCRSWCRRLAAGCAAGGRALRRPAAASTLPGNRGLEYVQMTHLALFDAPPPAQWPLLAPPQSDGVLAALRKQGGALLQFAKPRLGHQNSLTPAANHLGFGPVALRAAQPHSGAGANPSQ